MISLFLDTCSHNIIVAILEENEIIYYKNEISDNNLAEKLLPYIKTGFEAVNKNINSIEKIYVVNGPGSFTGIRIGVTVAKVLAYSLNVFITTISELEAISSTSTDKKFIVPMIDARRDYVYTGVYDSELNNIVRDQYVLKNKFIENLEMNIDDILFVSYGKNIDNVVEPVINIEKIIKKHEKDISLNPHNVNPEYLKLTEAEENLIDKIS